MLLTPFPAAPDLGVWLEEDNLPSNLLPQTTPQAPACAGTTASLDRLQRNVNLLAMQMSENDQASR